MRGITRATKAPEMMPGSEAWRPRMSASKIAAVVGASPYESWFSLWHKMAGVIPWDDDRNSDEKARGHYLEPALRQWWRDKHPEFAVNATGPWASVERPWQIASPDGIVSKRDIARTPVALVECKTSALDSEWGKEGTDEVPPYYRYQAIWAMDTLGLDLCHFSVLTSYLEFRQFVVPFDAETAGWLRREAEDFMRTLGAGERPSLGEPHVETYRAVRHLNPGIEDELSIVPDALAIAYAEVQRDAALIKGRQLGVVTELASRMGTARKAVTEHGDAVAYRKSVKGGAPFVSPARALAQRLLAVPTPESEKDSS